MGLKEYGLIRMIPFGSMILDIGWAINRHHWGMERASKMRIDRVVAEEKCATTQKIGGLLNGCATAKAGCSRNRHILRPTNLVDAIPFFLESRRKNLYNLFPVVIDFGRKEWVAVGVAGASAGMQQDGLIDGMVERKELLPYVYPV
jgi:hypothetical protein